MAVIRNFQLELEKLINSIPEGEMPSLCLHACCAPCASYCLEYLSQYFDITVYFYNPNIASKEEYDKRANELKRLIDEMPMINKPQLIIENYDEAEFYTMAEGMEDIPEGGERCFKCYRLRLEKTAHTAKKINAEYFATTLTISPLKNSAKINEITEELAVSYGIKALPGDFKKKNGYKRSLELSKIYNLYRQNYCGCIYSIRE